MTTPERPEPGPVVERIIAAWLRTGVITSVALIIVGFVVSIVRHPEALSDADLFRRLTAPGAIFPHTMTDLGEQLLALRGRAIITLGILVLLLTPVVRVALSIIAFALERDWVYIAITSGVLALLLVSFLIGAAH